MRALTRTRNVGRLGGRPVGGPVPGGRAGGRAAGRAAGDRIERAAPRAGPHYDLVLVWFMRAVALVWLAKALAAWGQILGALPGPSFEAARLQVQAAIVYFGVIDAAAGVGLWLASSWGGVIWLLAATSYLVLALVVPALGTNPLALAATAALLLAYLVLSWLAAREVR